MRILLDTHALLWWLDGGRRLSRSAQESIRNPENEIFVSSATAWEIVVKKAIGKLIAPDNLEEEVIRHRFERLPVLFSHVMELQNLPNLHNDPFDRMLVAQTRVEGFKLMTRDANIKKYRINFIEA